MANSAAPADPAGDINEGKRDPGRFTALLWLPLTAIGLALIILLVMFARFTAEVTRLGAEEPSQKADGIVVLTGDRARISYALELLNRGQARRLLISGVHEMTSRHAIRRVTGSGPDLFDCCVDIDRKALDTVGNAEQTKSWARDHGFRKIIVVTSDYHMPRSLIEFERKLTGTEIIPAAVRTPVMDGNALPFGYRMQTLGGEFVKYIVACLRLGIREKENRNALAGAFSL